MDVHVIPPVDPERDQKITDICNEIQAVLEGKEIEHVLSALNWVYSVGVRVAAEAEGITCVGWAYRVVDQGSENVKQRLQREWGKSPTEPGLEGAAPAGNC